MHAIPVITVDGPGGSGKGTVSQKLAQSLGWHFLDSGALYRLLALAAQQNQVDLLNEKALRDLTIALNIVFDGARIWLDNQEVGPQIRTEQIGKVASQVATFEEVRKALLARQRAFLKPPGLVADGRDMGTVVFPQANLKIFLEASPLERAKRRQAQLKQQGIDVSLEKLFAEIAKRDRRDRERRVAPLVAAPDALIVDTTSMSIEQVFDAVMHAAKRCAIA